MKVIFQKITTSLTLFYFIVLLWCGQSIDGEELDGSDEMEEERFIRLNSTHSQTRDGRVFPFFAVVKIGTERCGNSNGQGICRTRKQCDSDGGNDLGISCSNGYGVCCSLTLACSASNTGKAIKVPSSGTHITQPTSYTPPNTCRFSLTRPDGICQVRLDFIKFTMANPDVNGDCVTDSMTIAGADNLRNFITCGENTGQHLYLHYGDSDSISLNFILNAVGSNYDILVTYIRCDADCTSSSSKLKSSSSGSGIKIKNKYSILSKNKNKNKNNQQDGEDGSMPIEPAPPGCSQYFTKPSDIVTSFNYHKVMDVAANDVTYQINNEMYTVCVKSYPGASKITWRECDSANHDTFHISKFPSPLVSLTGNNCTTDYVEINGAGKFCGTDFPASVTSYAQPFTMYVYFDDTELYGLNNPYDPATGCQVGYLCIDDFGEVSTVVPCPYTCTPGDLITQLTDLWNIGFCLQYTVA